MLSTTDSSTQDKIVDSLHRRGYRLEKTFASGRPDRPTFGMVSQSGTRVVAKIYPSELGERAFANMQQLWRSPFGTQRTPPALAQPLEYLPDIGALIMEWIEGQPLTELGALSDSNLEQSIRLLAELHQCGIQPELTRNWRGILRSVKRKAERIAELAPQYSDEVRTVIERLEATRIRDSELACSHGDFSPRNVLVSSQRWLLMDWDRLQRADPARDVAYFGTWPWRETLLRGRLPNRSSLEKAARIYESIRPGCDLEKRLPFHIAAGMVRVACGLVELWPQQAYLIPGLAKVALRELQ
ncbi:MAG TPA: aminoglycoside phosphotransferase family protein [Verrucomicrobiae bacterium]|nr:aminoglycoside phosphotransferase family protein [Verrucomicrobiae bacterium]